MARTSMPVQLVEAAVWYLIGSAQANECADDSRSGNKASTIHAASAETVEQTPTPTEVNQSANLRRLLAHELGFERDGEIAPESSAIIDRVLALVAAGNAAAASDPTTTISAAGYGAQREQALTRLGAGTGRGLAPWPPTQQTVMKRLGDGSWAQALEALGLQSAAGRARGRVRFDDADYTQAVLDFALAAEASNTGTAYAAYVEWCAAQRAAGVDRPSGSALRVRFGSWNAAISANN